MKIDFPFVGRLIFFVREPDGGDGWFYQIVEPKFTVKIDTPTFRADGQTYELDLDPQFAVCEIQGGRCFNPSTGRQFENLEAAEKYFVPKLQGGIRTSAATGMGMQGYGTVTPPKETA
jgi:hypothetical protein